MKVELISYDSRYIIQYQSVDYLKVVKKQAVCCQLAFYFEGSNDRIVLASLTGR